MNNIHFCCRRYEYVSYR